MKQAVIVVLLTALVFSAGAPARAEQTAASEPARLRFKAEGKGFTFDTGALRGTLHKDGRGIGLLPLIDAATSTPLARSVGIFSHYRLLDDKARYGVAGWEWPSTATLRPDGAVQVNWHADERHPFEMMALYRWAAPDTLDVLTAVNAHKELKKFEVFLASYFEGFPRAFTYTMDEAGGGSRFVEALQEGGAWQTYTRDAGGAAFFGDGRWRRPPNPVEWIIKGRLAGALALRRDEARGLTALVMAPPQDCFAVSMPYGEEAHRSLYLSMIGKDLKLAETAVARARLVIARGMSDEQAVQRYEDYLKTIH